MKTWQANICLIVVAMIWGAGFVATDEALKYLDPLATQILRFGIAAIILSIIFFKKLKNTSKKALIYGATIGVVFFASMTLQTFGLTDTTVPKNAFITVTNVIWVPIIAFILFKVKPRGYLLWGIIVMMVGFFFLLFEIDIFDLQGSFTALSSQLNATFGDFLTLLCAIGFALHIIMVGRFVKEEDPITILIFQLWVSAILSVVFYTFMEGNPLHISQESIMSAFPALIFMAIFSSVISFGLQLISQQYVPAANAAVILSTEALFASIFAVMMGSEALTISLVISAVVITIGIVWAETGFKFKEDTV